MSNTLLHCQRFERIRIEAETKLGMVISVENMPALMYLRANVVVPYLKAVMRLKEQEEWRLESTALSP